MSSVVARLVAAELRAHRARSAALAMAVALGAGLFAAAAVLGASMQSAADQGLGVEYHGVDLVVRTTSGIAAADAAGAAVAGTESDISRRDARRLEALPGVSAVSTLVRAQGVARVGDRIRDITLESLADRPSFRWQRWVAGRAPDTGTEVALTARTMSDLGVRIGDQVSVGRTGVGTALFTVVGEVDIRGSVRYGSMTYGVVTPPVARALAEIDDANAALLQLSPGTDPNRVIADINARVPVGWPQTSADLIRATAGMHSARLTALDGVTTGFATAALLVAALILATTTTVAVHSRRRALALLRCVGASRGQLFRTVVAEVGALGLLGALAGTAVGIGVARASLPAVGLIPSLPDLAPETFTIPWDRVYLSVALPLVFATAAAAVPAWRASRIPTALALDGADGDGRRARWLAPLAGSALVVGGGLLVADGAGRGGAAVLAAGAVAAVVGTLLAAGSVVSGLAGLAVPLFGRAGWPMARLAADGVARDRARASAEVSALVVATALLAFTWTAMGSVAAAMSARITDSPDADVVVGTDVGGSVIGASTLTAFSQVDGVAAVIPIRYGAGVTVIGRGERGRVSLAVGTATAETAQLDNARPDPFPVRQLRTDTVYLPSSTYPPFPPGTQVSLHGPKGKATGLHVEYVDTLGLPTLVAPRLLARVAGNTEVRTAWLKVADGTDRARVLDEISGVAALAGSLPVTGTLPADVRIAQAVGTARTAATALLAVALLIAVTGAATTLALSVAERHRDHALLRALGLERARLRRLLAIRVAVTGALGSVVGIVLGSLLGLATAQAVARALEVDHRAAVPLLPIVGLAVLTIVGVRAATLAPLETASYVPPARALAES